MAKPIIGILGAQVLNNNSGAAPVVADYCNHAYSASVEKAGGIPLLLPLPSDIHDLEPVLSLCQGLLVPGGIDVDPRFYHMDPLPVLGAVNEHLDRFWIHAVHFALSRRLPILGICRGMQLVNVALGGSLYQDLFLKNPNHILHMQHQNRDYLMHLVHITPDSRLAGLLGTDAIYTNTLHHQCVHIPGEGLTVTAQTSDGIPEAMENQDGSIMLVQWHPEELIVSEPRMLALFKDLINRAKQFR